MPNPENGLPSSVQTEVTVLGAMLLDAVAITMRRRSWWRTTSRWTLTGASTA